MNNIAYFEIQASKPKELATFYNNVFGRRIELDPNIPIEYYRISWAGAFGWLLKRPANIPPMECGTNAFTCSVEVDSFDAIAEKILANWGKEAMPKFAIPGKCRQGYFLDSDNNVFGIFEVDQKAGL